VRGREGEGIHRQLQAAVAGAPLPGGGIRPASGARVVAVAHVVRPGPPPPLRLVPLPLWRPRPRPSLRRRRRHGDGQE
jgi:hypothetical protein